MDHRAIPCPKGTYNKIEASSKAEECLPCPAGKACEKEGIKEDSEMVDCEPGYFCASGAKTRYPEDISITSSGPCPPGTWCAKGVAAPTKCAEGKFSKQWRATDESFCLPCPPGYLCLGEGNSDAT